MSEAGFHTYRVYSGPAFLETAPDSNERAKFRDLCNLDKLLILFDYWCSLYDSLGGIPSKDDFEPEKLGPALANIMMWKLVDERDWEVLQLGELAAEIAGPEAQPGKRLSEFASQNYLQTVAEVDRRMIEEGAPVFEHGRAQLKARKFFMIMSLTLPLLDDETGKIGYSVSVFVRII